MEGLLGDCHDASFGRGACAVSGNRISATVPGSSPAGSRMLAVVHAMPRSSPEILLVDDDTNFRKVLAYALEEAGYRVRTAANGAEALAALAAALPAVVLCDVTMPVMDGMAFLVALKERGLDVPVIVITAFGSIESAVAAMRAGAFDYVTKPVDQQALRLAVAKACEMTRLRDENRSLRERLRGGREVDRLIGSSPAMVALRATLTRLAESDAAVLLRGESGVGKELAARALHFAGPRAQSGSLVVLNCAAVPRELLESLLFGHRKGAFTGAHADQEGKIEAADRGTLFLDEIGDMPLELQAKLLRVLEDGAVERLGETKARQVDARIVAATNQPLEAKVRDGSFRRDLLYRIAVVPVVIPPLRERLGDLPLLLRHFLAGCGLEATEVPEETLAELRRRPWPGNVRELENLVLRAAALNPGLARLGPDEVRPALAALPAEGTVDFRRLPLAALGLRFDEVERDLLAAAWEQGGHNQTRAAELLGLPRQAFVYRLKKHGLLAADARDGEAEG